MDFNEYQEATRRTAPTGNNMDKQLLNYALGVAGESGEVADHIKKYSFQGHQLDIDTVAKELGDLLWYIARTADVIGYDLSEVAQVNINKLKRRYPNGFSEEASRNRSE